jgi:hypothetical protein
MTGFQHPLINWHPGDKMLAGKPAALKVPLPTDVNLAAAAVPPGVFQGFMSVICPSGRVRELNFCTDPVCHIGVAGWVRAEEASKRKRKNC